MAVSVCSVSSIVIPVRTLISSMEISSVVVSTSALPPAHRSASAPKRASTGSAKRRAPWAGPAGGQTNASVQIAMMVSNQ